MTGCYSLLSFRQLAGKALARSIDREVACRTVPSVLRNKAFAKLAFLYTTNCLVEWFGSVALMAIVYNATGTALAPTALLICKQILPGLAVAKMGEKFDGRSVRGILVVTLTGEAAALAAIALVGHSAALYLLAALAGFLGALTRIALRAEIARALGGEALRSGNALLNVAVAVTGMLGPAIAALAVAATSAQAALLIGVGTVFSLAIGAWLLLDAGTVSQSSSEEEAANEPLRATSSPLSFGWVLGLAAVGICFCTMDEPVVLPFSETVLGAGVGGYGAIYAAWGVGLGVGSLAFTRILDRSMLAVCAVATVLAGLGYIGMGLAPTLAAACAAAVLGGFGNGMGWVALITAVQESVSWSRQAEAAAKFESIAMVAPGVGIAIGGLLADFAGARVAMVLPGVGVLVLVALGCLVARLELGRPRAGAHHTLLPPAANGGKA